MFNRYTYPLANPVTALSEPPVLRVPFVFSTCSTLQAADRTRFHEISNVANEILLFEKRYEYEQTLYTLVRRKYCVIDRRSRLTILFYYSRKREREREKEREREREREREEEWKGGREKGSKAVGGRKKRERQSVYVWQMSVNLDCKYMVSLLQSSV